MSFAGGRGSKAFASLYLQSEPPNLTNGLAKEFSETNTPVGRWYYSVGLYNPHHLSPDMVRALAVAHPPDHAKYRSVILGKRGLKM